MEPSHRARIFKKMRHFRIFKFKIFFSLLNIEDINKDQLTLMLLLLINTLTTFPFRFIEKLLYNKKIYALQIKNPVFIIGHWRSGTTLLHDVLSKDPMFCFPVRRQVFYPEACIHKYSFNDPILHYVGPRGIDNIIIDPDQSPCEDELAMVNLGALSSYYFFLPPEKHTFMLKKSTTFEAANVHEITYWKKKYVYFLKKILFINPGKILLSKNPSHTARINVLLELFPDAKFIHICRNPQQVIPSYLTLLKAFYKHTPLTSSVLQNEAFLTYQHTMNTFLKYKDTINSDNFIEIKYEDFEMEPMKQLEKIYTHFNFNHFNHIKHKFEEYLLSIQGYEKNTRPFSQELHIRINSELGTSIQYWKGIGV